jgi:hypothetical protein
MTKRSFISVPKIRQIVFAGYALAVASLKGKLQMNCEKSTSMPGIVIQLFPFTVSFQYIMYAAAQKDILKTH